MSNPKTAYKWHLEKINKAYKEGDEATLEDMKNKGLYGNRRPANQK